MHKPRRRAFLLGMRTFQDIEIQETNDMAYPKPIGQFILLPLHGGLFMTAFVIAHLAALGVAYAAAALHTPAYDSLAEPHGPAQAVHHLGQMRLVPLQKPTPSAR